MECNNNLICKIRFLKWETKNENFPSKPQIKDLLEKWGKYRLLNGPNQIKSKQVNNKHKS